MNRQRLPLKCPNCGHEFTASPDSITNTEAGRPAYSCPVCQYLVLASSSTEAPTTPDIADIQAQLDLLLRSARASGVQPSELVELLRDELQFEAELAQVGRRMVVQIIDLGPQEMASTTSGADPHDVPNMRSALS